MPRTLIIELVDCRAEKARPRARLMFPRLNRLSIPINPVNPVNPINLEAATSSGNTLMRRLKNTVAPSMKHFLKLYPCPMSNAE
ncbi:MAG: hypothetical protein Q9216_005188 [Gyalolechia sp. 2 TL-2023]